MKLIINILILIVLTIGVLTGIFYVWGNYQKTELKYQACLEKCEADYCGFGNVLIDKDESCLGCKAECKEKYAK